jgi:hypothetical protein
MSEKTVKRNISGCQVQLLFSCDVNPKNEKSVLQNLLSTYEENKNFCEVKQTSVS